MKLKTLTLMLGETQLILRNTKMEGDKQIDTPIDFDPIAKLATVHLPQNEKMIVDVSKLIMYRYIEDKPVVQ